MKSFTAAAVAFAAAADAYPSLNLAAALSPPQGVGFLPISPPKFDPAVQYVNNQGEHAFVAPGPDDARGPCPGLNAAANHNYLPHNGQGTIAQFIEGTRAVFGMNEDLAGFLSIYGAFVDGDGIGWSIGGGNGKGMSGSHHNYECDSSPLKADLNQYGSNVRTIDSQFMTLYNMQNMSNDQANYNLEVLREFRIHRYRESIAKNPYFLYGPFDGVAVSQAAFTFIYRFMANKSAEHPEGILNKEVLKSFMSYSGPENNLTHTPGHEKIPDDWYKRHPTDQYSIPYFISDINGFASKYPEIIAVGCNFGHVNTYENIGLNLLSGGLVNDIEVLANPFCFASGMMTANMPEDKKAGIQSALAPHMAANNCTFFPQPNTTALSICPGLTLNGGPTGPVAPGAIQS